MIGRAAQGAPWIFREIEYYLRTNKKLSPPSLPEIQEILMGHIKNLYDFYGEDRGVKIARKHVSWYSKGQRDSGKFRSTFNHAETATLQTQMIHDYFGNLREGAETLV